MLIADDIGVSRDAIIESLSVANIKADVATGGKEAVAKMRAAVGNSAPYDVLILDWNMPDIDGLEVAALQFFFWCIFLSVLKGHASVAKCQV